MLRHVAALLMEVFQEQQQLILRGKLILELAGDGKLVGMVVRALARIIEARFVQSIREASLPTVLRRALRPAAIAAILTGNVSAVAVLLKQAHIVLIAQVPRKRARADGREQRADQPFAAGGRFVAEVVILRVANQVIAIGQE